MHLKNENLELIIYEKLKNAGFIILNYGIKSENLVLEVFNVGITLDFVGLWGPESEVIS